MMLKEIKCEDVIDLSSDDEGLPQFEILGTDSSIIAGRQCNGFDQQVEAYDDQKIHQAHGPSLYQLDISNAYQITGFGIPFESGCVGKVEAEALNDGHAHDLVSPQLYFQNSFTGTPLPINAQQNQISKKFWKAGDYNVVATINGPRAGGIEHARVHPKFLHSNATSHKWALGAIAELLDNAIDEVQNGATYVKIDVVSSPIDKSPMLVVQDDGGGMDPDCMRQCMSLGYSRKTTKSTIGQYGNGFKTSTMRLGADVIVFSHCSQNGYETESIGLLSYTFLRETGKEDIIVPMVDFQLSSDSGMHNIFLRTSEDDWRDNLQMILQWSPFKTEGELLGQLSNISSHGTKIIVYNLWLNDDGELELDFDTDWKDIQLRGGTKTSKGESLFRKFTSAHISNRLRYSLRAYSSVLYLRMPERFQIFLRGEPVEHLSIAEDLKFPEHIMYKPQIANATGDVSVITTIGFAKEAPMINVHGFSVYHKNRLIMPFWRVFHENSSRGKGVVGVLEANFIEPAHDKQDFERTPVLQRLEARLKSMTIEYWNLHCELIGYQPPKSASRATTNATNASNTIPVDTSLKASNNQPSDHLHHAAIVTGIPTHQGGVTSHGSFNPHNFEASPALSLRTNENIVGGRVNMWSPRYKESQADFNLRSSFRYPGTSGPPTPPQPKPDTDLLSKHADTLSDGCSYLANSFHSDCSENSLHTLRGSSLGRANQKATQQECAGKRTAATANFEATDQASKRRLSLAMECGNLGLAVEGHPGNVDVLDSIEDVQQLRLRCKQYLWERQQLEVMVVKLQMELSHLQEKLGANEGQSRMIPKPERLD